MAAKLTWEDGSLMLGGKHGWTLGAVRSEGRLYRAVLNRDDVETREKYEEQDRRRAGLRVPGPPSPQRRWRGRGVATSRRKAR